MNHTVNADIIEAVLDSLGFSAAPVNCDLMMHDVDKIRVIMKLEDEFGVEISDKEAESLKSVIDFVDFVSLKLDDKIIDEIINNAGIGMKIEIMRCSRESYWYCGRIGETFHVIHEDATDYHVVPDDMGVNCMVLKTDAKIVNEEDSDKDHPTLQDVDKLDLLESSLASAKGCVTLFWDAYDEKIRYQVFLDDDDLLLEGMDDVYRVLEAQALIESYKKI